MRARSSTNPSRTRMDDKREISRGKRGITTTRNRFFPKGKYSPTLYSIESESSEWNIERKGGKKKKKKKISTRFDTQVRNEFRAGSLNHPYFSSEILVYLRGNKPWSDHLLFNRRVGFRSEKKVATRGGGKAGRREKRERKRERTRFGRETRLNVFIRRSAGFRADGRGFGSSYPSTSHPPAGNGPITCPPFLRTWPVILRSTFTNDPAYRSGSLRGR